MDTFQDNMKRLLDEAPPTRCGKCRQSMIAYEVVLSVGSFSWSDDRYTGTIEYRCDPCAIRLIHKQHVVFDEAGFHFEPPSES